MFAMFRGEPDRQDTVSSVDPSVSASGEAKSEKSSAPRKQLGKITLQVFRLPPLPGLKPEEMPQCIEECLRGMRHHAWHEHEYHEGVLTQEGGDCVVSRRPHASISGYSY